MEQKLLELRRPAFLDKVNTLLTRSQVDAGGIWLEPKTERDTLIDGLRRTIAARNDLVHNTAVGNPVQLNADLIRLQCLFERLVLAVIGYREATFSSALSSVLWSQIP